MAGEKPLQDQVHILITGVAKVEEKYSYTTRLQFELTFRGKRSEKVSSFRSIETALKVVIVVQASQVFVKVVLFKKLRHEQRTIIPDIDQNRLSRVRNTQEHTFKLLCFSFDQMLVISAQLGYFEPIDYNQVMAAHQCPSPLPGFKYRQCFQQKYEELYLVGNHTVQKYPIFQDDQIGFADRFWGDLISNDMDEDNESTDEIVESGVQRGIRILMKSTEVSKGKTTHHTDCEESYFSIESVKSASALDYQFPFQKKSTSFSEIHPTH